MNGNLDRSADSGVDHATEASLETELDYNGFDQATEIRQREVGETAWQTTCPASRILAGGLVSGSS